MKCKILIIISAIIILIPFSKTQAARLWSSGFELQSTTAFQEWDSFTGSPTISNAIKRSGAASLRCNASGASSYFFATYNDDINSVDTYQRFGLYIASTPSAAVYIFRAYDSYYSRYPYSISMDTSNRLVLRDYDGTTIDTSTALNNSEWYRVETSYIYSSGVVTARMYNNSGTLLDTISGDTWYEGDDWIAGTYFGVMGNVTADLYFDDVAVNDNSGSYQNSWPGDGKIVHLYPNEAGDIDETNSTPNAYQDVDEKPTPDNATSYAVFDATNDDLLVKTEDSSAAGINSYDNISLVQVGYRHRDSASSGSSVFIPKIESQSSGTLLSGTSLGDPGTTWVTSGQSLPRIKLVSYVDPQSGGAWTPSLLDTMQVGGTATDATPNVWISSIWAMVEYVPGTPPESPTSVIIKQSPSGPTIFRQNVIFK